VLTLTILAAMILSAIWILGLAFTRE